ncbi:hypothetical protein K439DRAFT_1620604 [Ramaria rubella]|nr:hypothetical protein K439DRAFT_1620604 [Ramaria rubella]
MSKPADIKTNLPAVTAAPSRLKCEDYPGILYWTKDDWMKAFIKHKNVPDPKWNNGLPERLAFLQNEDGSFITKCQLAEICTTACSIYQTLAERGSAPPKWDAVSHKAIHFYCQNMYISHPLFHTGDRDWKVDELATQDFTKWYNYCFGNEDNEELSEDVPPRSMIPECSDPPKMNKRPLKATNTDQAPKRLKIKTDDTPDSSATLTAAPCVSSLPSVLSEAPKPAPLSISLPPNPDYPELQSDAPCIDAPTKSAVITLTTLTPFSSTNLTSIQPTDPVALSKVDDCNTSPHEASFPPDDRHSQTDEKTAMPMIVHPNVPITPVSTATLSPLKPLLDWCQ